MGCFIEFTVTDIGDGPMRLIAFSLATCAMTAICLMALLVYALHVPTRAVRYVDEPSPAASPADASSRANWTERWAATNLRTIE